MNVLATHNPDSKIRRESSSGGAFSILAEKVISEGGVVYGVAFDDSWNVCHKRVDSLEELSALRGSKYVFSNVGEAYGKAMVDLESGRKVLFSGTPCQIAAMRKRVGENSLLLLVEIVCHGAPQPEYWTRYLSELCDKLGKAISDIESINFRDKRTGWKNYSFTIRFRDRKIFTQPHDDNIYMRSFLQDLTLREACFRCPFKYPDGSRADITLGDFWGYDIIEPQQEKNDLGISLVILRSKKGVNFEDFSEYSKKYSLNEVSKYNPALIKSVIRSDNYNCFKEDAKSNSLIKVMSCYTKRPLLLRIKLGLKKRIISNRHV